MGIMVIHLLEVLSCLSFEVLKSMVVGLNLLMDLNYFMCPAINFISNIPVVTRLVKSTNISLHHI